MAKTRCSAHISSIKSNSDSKSNLPIAAHFQLPGHSHSDMIFQPIEKIISKDPFVRKARESYYIKKFECLKLVSSNEIQHGLNLQP